MPKNVTINFSPLSLPKSGSAVVFVGADGLPAGEIAALLGEDVLRTIARAAAIERFKGKSGSAMTLLSPGGELDKLIQVEEKGTSQAFALYARFESLRTIVKAREAMAKKGYKIG